MCKPNANQSHFPFRRSIEETGPSLHPHAIRNRFELYRIIRNVYPSNRLRAQEFVSYRFPLNRSNISHSVFPHMK